MIKKCKICEGDVYTFDIGMTKKLCNVCNVCKEGEEVVSKMGYLIWISLFLLISFGMTSCVVSCSHRVVSNGEKIGTIIKVAEEGWWCPTYEIEMVRGGLNDGSGVFSISPFYFTVSDKQTVKILEEAMQNKRQILVKYHQQSFSPCASGNDGNYFSDEIIVK